MAEKFIIQGGGPLTGEIRVSGSKNAVLPVLAATLLTGCRCVVRNVPDLSDVDAMCALLESLGTRARWDRRAGMIAVEPGGLGCGEATYELVNKLRASFLVFGPLLARIGTARIPLPGGCAIGSRPVDLHLKGLAALGARIEQAHGFVSADCTRLKGAKIYLDFPSVGATENIIMAAALADGQTVLENCAIEPEVVDLANFLNAAGAEIRGAGTDTIKINGVKDMRSTDHTVIPDRIEAGTFMAAAAITRGDVLLTDVVADHVKPVTAKLKEVNINVTENAEGIRVRYDGGGVVRASDIKTMPYPGFPTDMQAPFMSLLTTAAGTSIISESVFENRFMQVGELKRMGAEIKIESRSAVVEGVNRLAGAQVRATDLRAGAALTLAALAADGVTELSDIHHIDRGYSRLDARLNQLGASIKRVDCE